jgi:hypothetical protein
VLTIVINFVGTTILAQLGKFEGHYDLEAYYVSDASKMALFTILNTAILQIYSDLVQTIKSPGLKGRLILFSPDWYKTTGAVICSTMLTTVIIE